MEGHARTWFTPEQKAELWERWKRGQCVADIARSLERRNKSGVYRILALNGGIAPAASASLEQMMMCAPVIMISYPFPSSISLLLLSAK